MRALGVTELLAAWERAYGQRPALRALTLVSAASSADDRDPGELSVGERDAQLLSLREATFGGALDSLATCEACGERMELSLHTRDLRAPPPTRPQVDVEHEAYRVRWRLPTSADVAAIAPDEAPDAASARLLEACVVEARRGPEAVRASELPLSVREALARAVEAADPQADVALTMECPECRHPNVVPFDVTTFFWDELNAWAHRTLREVHVLASAYGWSERDVLGMTPFRRRLYMEMLGP